MKFVHVEKEVDKEMKRSVLTRGKVLEFLYIRRAMFSYAAANGISLSFFSNCIVTER
ncbi:RAxF-45 family protein [Longirhabdus pacifica]|uniref:RAxF-45 family protein n=1 Tax=Longirhabdus pacifica TaxID=2305227 RepID=UPI0027BAE07A|nr:RAxF-45 family protein [Longirhabdus pacifica]